ncbi:hypothetical protein NQ314_002966 [Rhamnusium bicolor]|uniref:Uncharacterized protein n=1 Tax=Rhamnusium bicolor TaxID=1586634 RepID=A0AAV8ZQF8_9CUCU|nr:hypothetical protein NQ314_002966 [Rhamnusium bicolor]
MKLFLVIYLITSLTSTQCKIMDTSRHVISRQKRWLIWNEGVNWVQFIFGVGIPLEVKNQAITVGTVMKAFYLMPTNSSVYTRPSIDYERRKRSTSRWILYEILESYLERYKHVDGKACLLKAICETSQSPFDIRTGILAEIIHAVLTPSSTDDVTSSHMDTDYHAAEKLGKIADSCDVFFPDCGVNLIQQFTRFLS